MFPVRLVILILEIAFGLVRAIFQFALSLKQHEMRVDIVGGHADIRVLDGDTILSPDGQRLRLYGLDAPEYSSRAGRMAARRLRELLDTPAITYRIFGRDRYGRPLAVLYADGQDINRRLVEEGHVRAYRRYTGRYKAAERRARRAGRGNWDDGLFPPPEAVRHG